MIGNEAVQKMLFDIRSAMLRYGTAFKNSDEDGIRSSTTEACELLDRLATFAYAEGRDDEREQCVPAASDLPVGTMTARDGCTETQWNERRNTLMDGKYLVYVARVTR